jgi:general stress protein 26
MIDRVVRLLALRVRRWGQDRHVDDAERVVRAARRIIRKKKYCALATLGDDGVDARVLQPFPIEDDLVVWMGTSPASRKVQQLRRDPRATLVYEDDRGGRCATLVGHVEIFDDEASRHRWFRPSFFAFFPEGPDGDYVLLRFVPMRIEVWDLGSRLVPPPFGLRGATVVRTGGVWRLL